MTFSIAAECKICLHSMTFWMEDKRLVTSKLTLNRTLKNVSSQCRNMLDGYIFFSTKSAAYQHGFYNYLIRSFIPSKHVGNFFTSVVGTLIGRKNLYTIFIGERNSAFRLKECMLSKRCRKMLSDNVGRIFKCILNITTRNMTALAKIAFCFCMYKRSTFSSSLFNITHNRKLFILNFYKFFGRFKSLFILCDYHAKCIAQITCI